MSSSKVVVLEPLDTLVKYQTVLKQKDAVFRFFQFSSRALIYLLRNSAQYSGVRTKLASSMHTVVTGRKVFAFLNSMTELANFKNTLMNGEPMHWYKAVQLLKALMMAKFWFCENVTLLSKFAGVFKADNAWFSRTGARFWLTAVMCSIVSDASLLADYQPKPDATEPEKPEITEKRHLVRVRMCRNICDFFVASNNSQFLRLNEGLVGTLGAVSAVILIYELWPKKPQPQQ
eukprot:TRINITY_DN6329_c0_g1_i1.p2 TRINITY_DN6329_c0_g1~~TRINITY_DN6329_c0_g1_i1.p2  ORF type:complete len:241 (+),score=71.12 TRINITY_DN6329_c0_g1_i1:30-725(+)